MFNINGWEAAIILAIVLIVLGPERLPDAAIQFGKIVHELRRMADQATADLGRELNAAADEARQAQRDLSEAGAAIRAAMQPQAPPETGKPNAAATTGPADEPDGGSHSGSGTDAQ